MRYSCFTAFLFLNLSVFAMDQGQKSLIPKQDILQEIPLNDVADQPNQVSKSLPPNNVMSINRIITELRALQNNKMVQEDIATLLNKIYNDYFLSPSFSDKGGMSVLKSLAQEHGVTLKFSMASLPQAIKQAASEPKAIGRTVVVGLIVGSTVYLISLAGAYASALSSIDISNATYALYDYGESAACQTCSCFLANDFLGGGLAWQFFDDVQTNCSSLIQDFNETVYEYSAVCTNNFRLMIDAKNYYILGCYADGSVFANLCNIDAEKTLAKANIVQNYLLGFVMGGTMAITSVGVGLCCCANNISRWLRKNADRWAGRGSSSVNENEPILIAKPATRSQSSTKAVRTDTILLQDNEEEEDEKDSE